MPHIAVTMFPGRDRAAKEALAKKLQATLVEALGVSETVVSVSVQDIEKEDWAESMKKIPQSAMLIGPGTRFP